VDTKKPQGIILVRNSILESFASSRPAALLELAPWSISAKETLKAASVRLAELSVDMILAINDQSGQVECLITDKPEVAALGRKKKNRKWLHDQFEACFNSCHSSCANRGGCAGVALVFTPTGHNCTYWCNDDGDLGVPAIQDMFV
jgi:hypothetical protein